MKSVYFNDFESTVKQQIKLQYQCVPSTSIQHNSGALCATFTFDEKAGQFAEEYAHSVLYTHDAKCQHHTRQLLSQNAYVSNFTMNIINALDRIDTNYTDNDIINLVLAMHNNTVSQGSAINARLAAKKLSEVVRNNWNALRRLSFIHNIYNIAQNNTVFSRHQCPSLATKPEKVNGMRIWLFYNDHGLNACVAMDLLDVSIVTSYIDVTQNNSILSYSNGHVVDDMQFQYLACGVWSLQHQLQVTSLPAKEYMLPLSTASEPNNSISKWQYAVSGAISSALIMLAIFPWISQTRVVSYVRGRLFRYWDIVKASCCNYERRSFSLQMQAQDAQETENTIDTQDTNILNIETHGFRYALDNTLLQNSLEPATSFSHDKQQEDKHDEDAV